MEGWRGALWAAPESSTGSSGQVDTFAGTCYTPGIKGGPGERRRHVASCL